MKYLMLSWLVVAGLVAVAITLDMRRLRVNRAGLSVAGWAMTCAAAGALAAVPYLIQRRRVRRQLLAATWVLIGDESQSAALRRERLDTLWRNGLLGESIFRACAERLESETCQFALDPRKTP
ncbi:hypothetical protein PCO31111_04585 [Pandoraea communis]|uniref:Uncharacterized protein n=1 Tax=Pandoraea communis TaxID=2508297 RepID=A0A5E4YL04_9BURK|nr:hypothetical protein [Pandoraea communis]VVE48663.1 hypothetical protein PCO31111_04585 [Pandoraea communis]